MCPDCGEKDLQQEDGHPQPHERVAGFPAEGRGAGREDKSTDESSENGKDFRETYLDGASSVERKAAGRRREQRLVKACGYETQQTLEGGAGDADGAEGEGTEPSRGSVRDGGEAGEEHHKVHGVLDAADKGGGERRVGQKYLSREGRAGPQEESGQGEEEVGVSDECQRSMAVYESSGDFIPKPQFPQKDLVRTGSACPSGNYSAVNVNESNKICDLMVKNPQGKNLKTSKVSKDTKIVMIKVKKLP